MPYMLSFIVKNLHIVAVVALLGYLIHSYQSMKVEIVTQDAAIETLESEAAEDAKTLLSYQEAMRVQEKSKDMQIASLRSDARRLRSENSRLDRIRKTVRMSNETITCDVPNVVRDTIDSLYE